MTTPITDKYEPKITISAEPYFADGTEAYFVKFNFDDKNTSIYGPIDNLATANALAKELVDCHADAIRDFIRSSVEPKMINLSAAKNEQVSGD